MNLRTSLRIILDKDAKRPEMAGAMFQWASASFIGCLIVGVLDTGSIPELALLAGSLSFLIVTFLMMLLRRAVCGRL